MKELSTGYGFISVPDNCQATITQIPEGQEGFSTRRLACEANACGISRIFMAKKGTEQLQDSALEQFIEKAEQSQGFRVGQTNK